MKTFSRVVFLAVIGVPLLLPGSCLGILATGTQDEHWNQRLTLVIETPTGSVSGAVVQRIDWQGTRGLYKSMTSGVDASLASVRVTGEALAIEVMPDRWLFALLKGGKGWQGAPGSNAGYAIGVPLGHFARSVEAVEAILDYPEDTPIPLAPEAWPMLVTFDDITKPETVREVDPEDLAAVFGEGVRLKAVTLEITKGAVTEGRLDNLLGWLEPYPEPALGPSTGESLDDSPLYLRVHMGDFIRRLM